MFWGRLRLYFELAIKKFIGCSEISGLLCVNLENNLGEYNIDDEVQIVMFQRVAILCWGHLCDVFVLRICGVWPPGA